jgi:hypothetical protein
VNPGADPPTPRRGALVLRSDGRRALRFEEFRVENGPDLRVYLSSATAADENAHDDDFVDLGAPKAM